MSNITLIRQSISMRLSTVSKCVNRIIIRYPSSSQLSYKLSMFWNLIYPWWNWYPIKKITATWNNIVKQGAVRVTHMNHGAYKVDLQVNHNRNYAINTQSQVKF